MSSTRFAIRSRTGSAIAGERISAVCIIALLGYLPANRRGRRELKT
jgi:hypothetical protein